MPYLRPAALALISILLVACANADGERRFRLLPGVFRFPIQQGNIVTQEMIDQLQPGMTRAQVRFVMGTPLVADTFAQNRWDYLYDLTQPSGKKLREQVSIHFDGDRLVGISGDYLPSAAAAPGAAAPAEDAPGAAPAAAPAPGEAPEAVPVPASDIDTDAG
ncbi:MAG TPA: outer membrane protein assembly factor BamE [Porticoccaceae bacterium]|nr:outer membrane protein assembly factor BamE [Porticoccaceae bacterium]